jgi:hypothetical protein
MTDTATAYLRLAADSVDDIEKLRIAAENRLSALTRTEEDKDGLVRGQGLSVLQPERIRAEMMLASIKALEHEAVLDLQRAVRKHPVYPWLKRSKGVGEKQGARLLASIGDPYWNSLHNRPRTVSELWAYCGYSVIDGAAQRRQKGQQSNWSSEAKMRAFLIAESCVKAGGQYREVYDAARTQYKDAIHSKDCVRCGPSGTPAKAGTPLSAGHQHARALRAIAKRVLQDIWIEARTVHEQTSDSEQAGSETQTTSV